MLNIVVLTLVACFCALSMGFAYHFWKNFDIRAGQWRGRNREVGKGTGFTRTFD